MKIICALVLAVFGALAAADVSHLASHYLPPSAGNNKTQQQAPPATGITSSNTIIASASTSAIGGATVTEIEQQELRELPVEVEYQTAAPLGGSVTPLTMQMMTLSEELQAPPAVQFVPTAATPAAAAVPAPAMVVPAPAMAVPAPAMAELALASVAMASAQSPMVFKLAGAVEMTPPPQPTYQQYQEHLVQSRTEAGSEMADMAAKGQMESVAISVEEQQLTAAEPQPGHILTADGYQYKGDAASSATSMENRYRARL